LRLKVKYWSRDEDGKKIRGNERAALGAAEERAVQDAAPVRDKSSHCQPAPVDLPAPAGRHSRIPGMSSTSAGGYGKAFDDVAAEYERSRPTYPDELFDRACRVAVLVTARRDAED